MISTPVPPAPRYLKDCPCFFYFLSGDWSINILGFLLLCYKFMQVVTMLYCTIPSILFSYTYIVFFFIDLPPAFFFFSFSLSVYAHTFIHSITHKTSRERKRDDQRFDPREAPVFCLPCSADLVHPQDIKAKPTSQRIKTRITTLITQ